MTRLDHWLEGLADGRLWLALVVAVLLGLRHATDPDHLTGVTTLVLSDDELGTRRAARLGLAWGLGHGTTLLALGLPVVLFNQAIPDWAQRGAEALIGLAIVAMAARLLVRWRRGYFHAHAHHHGHGHAHAHPHYHPHGEPHAEHAHPHAEGLGRSPAAAFGIGLLHGAGGSAAAGVVLVAAVPGTGAAAVALVLFALASAASMALASLAWARVLITPVVLRRLFALVPAFGIGGLAFGTWYGLGALG